MSCPNLLIRSMLTSAALSCALLVSSASPVGAQTEIVIHNFRSNSKTDGSVPYSDLVTDSSGALYGTTAFGGKYGVGTIYKLVLPMAPGGVWRQNILYFFTGGQDGGFPSGTLLLDSRSGKLYGTATPSETSSNVFELSPPTQRGNPWTESVIYNLTSTQAYSGIFSLVSDGKGRLYGTTAGGGRYQSGSVFALYSSNGFWNERDLYSFQSNDGEIAFSQGLALNSAGELYGVTSYGDPDFSLSPPSGGNGAWTMSTLLTLSGATGSQPVGSLILDNAGNLYGTTLQGGENSVGTVFQLARPRAPGGSWMENVLYSFQSNNGDGAFPTARL